MLILEDFAFFSMLGNSKLSGINWRDDNILYILPE